MAASPAASTSMAGVEQIPMMLNPVFESSSPSDFWGRRWNLVGETFFHFIFQFHSVCLTIIFLEVHGVLKRGVHKPVRAKYSRLTATVATFFASGIFHEWVLSGVLTQTMRNDIYSMSLIAHNLMLSY